MAWPVVAAACWSAPAPPGPQGAIAVAVHVQETIVRDSPSPFAMSIDGDHVFWVGGEDGKEGIWRADKRPGAQAVLLARTQDARGLTAHGDSVWWADGKAVHWVKKSGGPVTVALADLPEEVQDITRDGDAVVVAWFDNQRRRTKVTRYAIADGRATRALEAFEVVGSAPIMLAQPEGLYVGSDAALVRIRRDGKSEVISIDEADIQTLAFDTDVVLFASLGGVYRAPRKGGTAVRLATTPGVVSDVTTDDRFVYWGASIAGEESESGTGAIYRMPKRGGRARVLWRLEGRPSSVIANGDHIYWADIEQGQILRRRRAAE